MKLALRLALKDILSHKSFSTLFVMNLIFGLLGLTLVENFRVAIESSLLSRSKGVLAADLSVGARRPLTESETQTFYGLLPIGSEKIKTFESFTMLAGSRNTRLVEMKAIQQGYPFYGEIELKNRGVITGKTISPLFSDPRIWVFPELLTQLELQIGDKVQLGKTEFTIDDVILRDSSSVGSGFSFAPPIYLAYSHLENTGLMEITSRGYHATLLRLPENVDNTELAEKLNKALPDPGIQVVTSQNASEQVGRALAYLTDYLGLAGLVAMFLTAIGQFFLFRNYISRRHADVAVLRSLGADNRLIFTSYSLQVIALSFVAFVIAMTVGYFIVPLFTPWIKTYLQIDIEYQFPLRTFVIVGLTAFWGGFLTSLPLLISTLSIQAKELLSINSTQNLSFSRQVLSIAPTFLLFLILSMVVANSLQTGAVFVFALSLAGALAFAASWALFEMLKLFPQKNILLKVSIRQILRERYSSMTAFIVLCLAVSLTALLPQVEAGLKDELQTPQGLEHPSLFMFDVQDEQVQELQQYLKSKNITPMQSSPMVRARLNTVNGMPFEKGEMRGEGLTREQENENRFRNRGFNLSYRKSLTPSERIYKGITFENAPSDLPKISLERRFADRLKLKIDDVLEFDVQGIMVSGRVVNTRHVRWTSFQPNFFIQFDEGALEDAPKTHLLTLPELSETTKMSLQSEIVKLFPNVSIIDVSRLVERLSGIINQMTLALQGMSAFTVVVGLLVLYAIQVLQAYYRRKNTNLYKVLGADYSFLLKMVLVESGLIASMAIVTGLIIARLLNYGLAQQLFEGLSRNNPSAEIVISVFFIVIIFFVTWLSTKRVLQEKPQSLFQAP